MTFVISESDPRWKHIQELIGLFGAADIIDTSFSAEEILQSEWNRLVPRYEWGYPQPEKQMLWKKLTFDVKCSECGAGIEQKAPILLLKEPRLGKHDFFTTFWTYSIFCKREIENILKDNNINGFEVLIPIIKSTNQPSCTVSQLMVTHVAAPGLAEMDKRNPEVCSECGIIKYGHHRRGKLHLHREALNKDADFQLTFEWFGSGARVGFREVIVSNRLSSLIVRNHWKGIVLKPIELV